MPCWEHFDHGADIGVRGVGATREAAFEQIALALTGVITDPAGVRPELSVAVTCEASADDLLVVDWLNAIVYEMATRRVVFGKFQVHLDKGATRALGPGHPDLPPALLATGQPVLIGGTMGTASYVMVGTAESLTRSFGSSCHGAGRSMSRHEALRHWRGREVIEELASRGIIIRSPSFRGVAEEAPGAYKDVSVVVDAADRAGLSHTVVRLEPCICIKG